MDTQDVRVFRCLAAMACAALIGLSSCTPLKESKPSERTTSQRQRTLLDPNWSFHLGDISTGDQVISSNYDDASWQHVDVPHDYVLDGIYKQSNDRGHGYLTYDVGWYRKHISIPASDQGKILRLDFDGVFRDSKVYLNGQLLGEHQSGYTPFSYDITKIAKIGGDNILVVRVDPREFEGWWYEGGGIYRHVYLTALNPVHIAQYGTYVVSTVPNGDQGPDNLADLTIQTNVENSDATPANCQVVSEILGPDGKSIRTIQNDVTVAASNKNESVQHVTIDHPKLWSLQSPNLYQLHTTILHNGQPIDATTTTFGIRTIRFDKDKGFFLNGQRVEIQGAACHQDFPGVGIAVPDSLEFWRVQQLKNMGANGWRTAHNPPDESVLDACDRIGMLVMDENRHFGDTYRHHAQHGTAADDLSDLATMIQRDRNHPSVIMWSMCNEEGLQGSPEGPHILKSMMTVVHRYDKTRPITSAINARPNNAVYKDGSDASIEDILGINYNNSGYDAIHSRRPEKPMFGSEDCNEKTARGEYGDHPALSTAYNLSEKSWQPIANHVFVAGAYVWTGFDYKGEPNPFGWPDVSNNTGLMDSCGFPKDKYYYFESNWSDKPVVHLLPINWNPTENAGKTIRVIAFSNAKQVELFLNGKSLGTKDVARGSHAEWQVQYQPGQLFAKGYKDGKTVATDTVETTSPPARIKLSVDRTKLHANAEDTVVVAVSVLDYNGRVVPDAANRVTFHLSGGGKILGVGNGNPTDHDTDKADNRSAFHGHCIAVIQAGSKPAMLHLIASSPGLVSDTLDFNVK